MGLPSYIPITSTSRASFPQSCFSLFLPAIIVASALHLSLSISHAFFLQRASFLPGLSSSDVTASGLYILTHTSVAPAMTLTLSTLEYLTTQHTTHPPAYALFVTATMCLGWLVSWLDWTACRGEWCRPVPTPATHFYPFVVCFAWWAGGLVIALAYAACGIAEAAVLLGFRSERVTGEVEDGWTGDEKVFRGGYETRSEDEARALGKKEIGAGQVQFARVMPAS